MDQFTLITGAAGGLGRVFAVECARCGHNLFITDLSTDKLTILADTIKSTYGVKVIVFACNLTEIDERQNLFSKINSANIELYMTINVAGLDYEGGIETLSSKKISYVIRLNTEATLDITRFASSLEHKNDFYIINVASMAGFFSMPLKALYAASKRAIIQFSLAIREEIKHKKGHVLTLCPAGLKTMPEVTASIESQGFIGQITTIETGRVAFNTINKALKNKAKYIPGAVNMLLVGVSNIIPDTLKAKMIYKRWSLTRKKAEVSKLS